jgi:hypothetical protein
MVLIHRRPALLLALVLVLGLVACGRFRAQADEQFGDQNFKSAIALIELHKVRFGSYPDQLSDLKFTGQWDQIWMSAVKYTRLTEGYELDLVRGWVGTPSLEYPPDFWRGLGLRKTNMRRSGGV